MKKQLMTLALAAVVGSACADYVESSNIVGYEKVDLAANTYFISGVQFVKVGGENATLNDLLPDGAPYGTEILFMNSAGLYDGYKYLAEAYDEVTDDFIEGWGDDFDNYNVEGFDVGVGFWVKAPSAATLTQLGEVTSDTTITVSLPAGQYVLVANGLPSAFNPNEVDWTGIDYGVELLVMNSQGLYDGYKFLSEAYDEVTDDFIEGWGDDFDNYVTDSVITPGQGFWMKSDVATTVTISL